MATAGGAWALVDEAAAALAGTTGVVGHDVVLVLGSGWLPAQDRLAEGGRVVAEVPLASLPGFPAPVVDGHGSTLRSIELAGGSRVLCLAGRVHAYEGHADDVVVHGVRVAAAAGCRVAVLTNAAGGLRDGMRVGQPVLVADHLNLTGRSPLTGDLAPVPHGHRFVDMVDAWSPRLRALALEVDPTLEEGVYAGLNGPQYETPAEVRMLRTLGADLVGMSTVHEAIAARHVGLELLGLSLVTNLAAGMTGQALSHREVLAAGRAAAERMGALVAEVVRRL